MAEALFRSRLDNGDIVVSSAGLVALVDKPAAEEAQEAMRNIDIDISQHRAKQLSKEMVLAAELILVMEKWQKKEIECTFSFARGKVHLIGKWSGFEVPDPYKSSIQVFESCLEMLETGWQDWQHTLLE